MIKPWVFEFMHAPDDGGDVVSPERVQQVFAANLAIWEDCERVGFEGVFFSEHHFLGQSYSPSPNLLIAAIAQRTTTLRLGVMGVVLPFYEPWRVIEEIGMLDHLTGGRFEIGCAAGIPPELVCAGLDPAEARARFDEMLDILDAGLGVPMFSHRGTYWNFENLELRPRPLQQPAPAKWTTVVSDGSARKSAARGSKICTGFESVARIGEIFDAYRQERAKGGAPATADDLAIRRNVSIAASLSEAEEMEDIARQTARKIMAKDPRVAGPNKSVLDAPDARAGFSVSDEEFIAGTPEQVAEQVVAQCRACGAGHFLTTLARGSEARRASAIRLFGEKVIPVLRSADLPSFD